jgi:alpha-N-arabinofuranosidase
METKITLEADGSGPTIDRNIYGHFSEHLGRCIYGGIWVGEDSPIPNTEGYRTDVLEALQRIKVPTLRWPGGCFADEYHWEDGIGPRAARPSMINTHWGGVVENNHFGTHEFMRFCELLGCEPYVNGNVGSGTVREMSEWVEYLTFDGDSPQSRRRAANGRKEPWKLKYFGVGNENWGCGGNMRPEFYADLYRQYQTYVRNYGKNKIFRIACGPNNDDAHWTEVLMREAGRFMDALTMHYYAWYSKDGTWTMDNKTAATGFPADEWHLLLEKALKMERMVSCHETIMDRYDPERRIALIVDEWGAWHKVEPGTNPGFLYQQNTIRDALIAAVTLHIFHDHAARVRMANLAQTINVLQAVLLTEGNRMVKTPTWHVFEMFTVHHDATALPLRLNTPDWGPADHRLPSVSASASRDKNGKVHISLANLQPDQAAAVELEIRGHQFPAGGAKAVSGRVLAGRALDHHNSFDDPDSLVPVALEGIRISGNKLMVNLPPRSVAVLDLG